MPSARNVLGRPHPTGWGRPLHTQRGRNGAPQHLLAKSPEMDYELLLSYSHRDSHGGILPPPGRPPDLPTAESRGGSSRLLPAGDKPSDSAPPCVLPLPFGPPGTPLLKGSDKGSRVCVPPPSREVSATRPPYEESPADRCSGSQDHSIYPRAV